MAPRKGTPRPKAKKCPNCKLVFIPGGNNPANWKRQRFCKPECKSNYHLNGGMDIVRLQEVVTRNVMKGLLANEEFVERISDKMRVKRELEI